MSSGISGKKSKVEHVNRGPLEARASREELLKYYREMLLIRRFEEKTAEMYKKAKIGGYCHLNLGEEATIVGAMATLEPRDYIFTNYREHGYILARGSKPGNIMAELFGKQDGVSKGRGGSMHMFDVEKHFIGGYAIVGGQLPLATGVGLAISYRGEDAVVLAQMGDATTNIGAFHESLNLAKIWHLPVVFFVVNNHYGMGTTVEKASAQPELYRRAAAYDMYSERVDGNDVLAVRDAMRRAVRLARQDKEPSLIELVSNRLKGHSVVDPDKYRSPEIKAKFAEDDPILLFQKGLLAEGILSEAAIEEIELDVEREVDEAVDFADASPFPPVTELFDHIYATPVANGIPSAPVY